MSRALETNHTLAIGSGAIGKTIGRSSDVEIIEIVRKGVETQPGVPEVFSEERGTFTVRMEDGHLEGVRDFRSR